MTSLLAQPIPTETQCDCVNSALGVNPCGCVPLTEAEKAVLAETKAWLDANTEPCGEDCPEGCICVGRRDGDE